MRHLFAGFLLTLVGVSGAWAQANNYVGGNGSGAYVGKFAAGIYSYATGTGTGGSSGATGFTVSGPSAGNVGVASTNFTVTSTGGSFSGSQTVTISDGSSAGIITPSVGSPAVSTITVTPTTSSNSFTFTYYPTQAGALTLAFTNGQSWSNPASLPYTATGVTYAGGPGDVVASAKTWWGLRAYTLAARGTNAIILCEPTNTTCINVTSDATTGRLTPPTNVGGTNCTTINTCTIKEFYDQSGAFQCTGSTRCDMLQNTAASRWTLTWNCLNDLPCAVANTVAGYQGSAVFNQSVAQPFTFSAMAERTANFTTNQYIFATTGTSQIMFYAFNAVASTMKADAGSTSTTLSNVTDSNWHTFQVGYSGASSFIFCGGSAGTNCSTAGTSNTLGTSGSNAFASSTTLYLGNSATTLPLSGNFMEFGVWSGAFTGTNNTNMAANQSGYYGSF